ncbi:MAG: peptidoglycan DD-metalloendopeptidase family protein [Cyclobacteriaceae bacterium]
MRLTALLTVVFVIVSSGLSAQKRGGLFSKKKGKRRARQEVQFNTGLVELLRLDYDTSTAIAFNADEYLEDNIEDSIAGPSMFYRELGIPVLVHETFEIDSIWLSADDYYNVWDSWSVNPYELDGEKFKDTVNLDLFDCHHDLGWSMPITNTYISSPFGMRRYRWHYGTDLKLHRGDSVRAAFDGIVRVRKYDRYGYGYYLVLRHYNGLETLYGHLSKRLVKIGQEIRAGEVIGLGGNTGRSTGSHLHFEVRYQGNAINPEDLYDFDADSLYATTTTVKPETFAYLKEARKVIWHKIRRGETLSHISYRYGVPINTICRLNGISRRTILRIGRRLRVN